MINRENLIKIGRAGGNTSNREGWNVCGPHNKFNEYKDFHECEVEGHICAAFLEMSGMTKVDGMDLFKKITVLL